MLVGKAENKSGALAAQKTITKPSYISLKHTMGKYCFICKKSMLNLLDK